MAQHQAEAEIGEATDMANQIATLLQNSTLLKSYETLMQQYEDSMGQKTKLLDQLERDYQQAMAENNTMCD